MEDWNLKFGKIFNKENIFENLKSEFEKIFNKEIYFWKL